VANVIIAIHGLGNKPPKTVLEKWWRLALIEGLKTNKYNTALPEFEMVYWSDILYEKPLDTAETDAESPYFIDEQYTKAPEHFPVEDYSTRRKVVDYMGKQMNRIFLNDDLTLNYSFISDVIINRYFKDLEIYYQDTSFGINKPEGKVSELIRERLYKKLQDHRNDNIMLISHSMGTIIAFDVLTFLLPDIRINTFITMGSPLGLPVIISKIAAEQRKRRFSDNVLRTPPGIIRNWYNFSDILDTVAFNYKLSDYFHCNKTNIRPIDYLIVNNYEINGKRNPHKSFGYLRTPEFSKILNEFVLEEKLSIGQKIARKIVQIGEAMKSYISPGK
jgi:hypothetical protein